VPTENAETPPVDRPDDTTRRRDWNVWNWVERIAMVSAVAFTAAGIGATAWLLSADGDDATAARTDGADLERFETAAGARMPSQVAVVPRTTIADAAKMAAVAALTPRRSAAPPAATPPNEPSTAIRRPVSRPAQVASVPAVALYVTRQDLNLRHRPAGDAAVIGVLPIDREVEELARLGGWMQVRTINGSGEPVQGWVDAQFLRRVR